MASTDQVITNTQARIRVGLPTTPDGKWKPARLLKCIEDGRANGSRISKVSGAIETMPMTVAKPAPNLIPEVGRDIHGDDRDDGDDQDRQRDGTADRPERQERVALGDAEQLGDVSRGQDHVDRRDRKPAQPVGPRRQPAQVRGGAACAPARRPRWCRTGSRRCGAASPSASSAANRHSNTPIAVASAIIGTAAAPRACTAGGSIPVTRIGPASPITNAPHQLVPFCKLDSDDSFVEVIANVRSFQRPHGQ